MKRIETGLLLSALWLFILLNIIFRDLHQFARKSELEMLLTGYYDGVEITDELMLLGGIMVQVPISMVLLSLLLTRRIGRPLTVAAGILSTCVMLSNSPRDMDDVFHLVVQMMAMTAIFRVAWTWPETGHISRSERV